MGNCAVTGVLLQLKARHRIALAIILAGATVAFLAWWCARNPKIAFLPGNRLADWILFPSAPDARPHHVADLDTVFRREFTLEGQPRAARLSVRAAKRVRLTINGSPVDIGASRNWKNSSSAVVLDHLRAGTNTIEARVFNDNGPPALWLVLATDQLTLRSDQTWEASCAGSAWRQASLASTPRKPVRGNRIAGGEETLAALAAVWPIWMGFGGLSLALWAAGRWWLGRLRRTNAAPSDGPSLHHAMAPLIVTTALWVVLFCNNARVLPHAIGFDAPPHLDYIRYIQEHRALPLPDEGWEMFQPPLYYAISAAALSSFGLSISDEAAGTILRWLTMLFGIGHFTLVYLSLRLLFPGRIGLQWVGLVLAAFWPMHLYLSHFVTNETLAALLVSASVYLCLRILKAGRNSWTDFSVLGFVIGAAVLTKFTAVLAVPFIVVALARRLLVQREPARGWWTKLGGMLAAAALICGWHYVRQWRHMGSAVVGGWDPASGTAWWQDDGYRVAAYFLRFGESLIRPLFSCTASFLDGIYATLWGDGLCGGVADMAFRPPWNYDLMCAGYFLATLPTALVLVGAVASTIKLLREGGSERFVLLGLAGAVWVGLLYLNLKVPYYASVKAFYGLCALVPLCFFGAVGWDVLTRGRKVLQFALGTILVAWALNSYASVWIRRDAAPTHICLGLRFEAEGRTNAAASEFVKAVSSDPFNAQASRFLARALDQLGRTDEALQHAGRAVQLSPADAGCRLQLGAILARQGRVEQAISEARRAVELGPEYTEAHQRLSAWLSEAGRHDEAVAVARDGLAVAPSDPYSHNALGLALAGKGDFAAATNQFAYALLLRPDLAEVHLNFGLALLQTGAFNQARVHFEEFLRENPSDAQAHDFLALALLRSGNAAKGLEHLQEAARLAPDSPDALNELAWFLATYSNAELRNGELAVRLAEHACTLAGRKTPKLLCTLAAAYAEAGRFPIAASTAREAIALAQAAGENELAVLNQELLRLYESGRPYHQKAEPPQRQ